MECGKAAGLVAQLLKVTGDIVVELVKLLTEASFNNDVITADWEESYILNFYEGKGDALSRGCNRGLKLRPSHCANLSLPG